MDKGISPKMTVIAWLEFEPTYYDVAVRHIRNYASGKSLF